MPRRIVVAVDPGLRNTGVAVAEEHSVGAIKTLYLVALLVIDFGEQFMIAQRFATVLAAVFEAIEKKYAKSGTLFFPGNEKEGLLWGTPRILGFTFHLAIESQNITRGKFVSDQTIKVAAALQDGFDTVLFQRYQTKGTVSTHRLVDWWVKGRKGPKLSYQQARDARKAKRVERMMEMLNQPLLRTLFGDIAQHVADAVLLLCAGCGLKYGAVPLPFTILMELLTYPGTIGSDAEGGLWVHKVDHSARFADGKPLLTVCRMLRGEAFAEIAPSPDRSPESSRSNDFFAEKVGSSSSSEGSSTSATSSSSSSGDEDSRDPVRKAKRPRVEQID